MNFTLKDKWWIRWSTFLLKQELLLQPWSVVCLNTSYAKDSLPPGLLQKLLIFKLYLSEVKVSWKFRSPAQNSLYQKCSINVHCVNKQMFDFIHFGLLNWNVTERLSCGWVLFEALGIYQPTRKTWFWPRKCFHFSWNE